MKYHPISTVLVLACLASLGRAQSGPALNETDLRNHIIELSTGSSARTALEPKTYYVRNQVFFNPTHLKVSGVVKPLKIIGATETVTGTINDQPVLKKVYKTRIVNGLAIPAADWKTWAQLPSDDPVKNRIPEAVPVGGGLYQMIRENVYWVDIPAWMAEKLSAPLADRWFTGWRKEVVNNETILTYDGWHPLSSSTAVNYGNGETTAAKVNREPIVASIGGKPLLFAESKDDPNYATNTPTWRWGRVFDDAASSPLIDSMRAYGTNRQMSLIPDGNNGDVRFTVFQDQDYRAVTTGLTSVEGFLSGGTPGVVAFQSYLQANPFAISDPTTSQSYIGQRFRIWNAPEYLWKPGTMVINTATRRIYFVPPTAIAEEDWTVTDWTRKMDSGVHPEDPGLIRIGPGGTPGTRSDPPSGVDDMLEISIPSFSGSNLAQECIKVDGDHLGEEIPSILIQDMKFGNGLKAGVNLEECKNVTIQNCFWRNFGSESLKIKFSKDVEVKDCSFRGSYNRMMTIQNGKAWFPANNPFFKPEGWSEVTAKHFEYRTDTYGVFSSTNPWTATTEDNKPTKFEDDIVNIIPKNIKVLRCTFEDGGLVYPDAPAVFMDGYPVGVTFDQCTFKNLPGVGLSMSGLDTTVKNSTFENIGLDCSDSAAVYSGRSWTKIGYFVLENTFNNVARQTPSLYNASVYGTVPVTSARNHLEEYPNAAIYFDDNNWGCVASQNAITNCHIGVKINRGRYIVADNPTSLTVPNAVYLLREDQVGAGPNDVVYSGLMVNSKPNAYYQHYRELGAFFTSPTFTASPFYAWDYYMPENYYLLLSKISNYSWGFDDTLPGWDVYNMVPGMMDIRSNVMVGTGKSGKYGAFPMQLFNDTRNPDTTPDEFRGFVYQNGLPSWRNRNLALRR